MAGVSRMGFGRFFFWDSLAALISVPLWIWLGYAASQNWKAIHERISGWVAWALGAAIVAILVWKFRHGIARVFGRRKPAIAADAPLAAEETPRQ
jgi:membrane protein DedA with SNARE-associated domain